jgi:hypothetical protein
VRRAGMLMRYLSMRAASRLPSMVTMLERILSAYSSAPLVKLDVLMNTPRTAAPSCRAPMNPCRSGRPTWLRSAFRVPLRLDVDVLQT